MMVYQYKSIPTADSQATFRTDIFTCCEVDDWEPAQVLGLADQLNWRPQLLGIDVQLVIIHCLQLSNGAHHRARVPDRLDHVAGACLALHAARLRRSDKHCTRYPGQPGCINARRMPACPSTEPGRQIQIHRAASDCESDSFVQL